MITVARLRPKDRRKGWGMGTYTSANSRTKYTAGDDQNPSAFRVMKDQGEIDELHRFPQFEVLQLRDMQELEEFTQQEMEERARVGLPAVRAAIMGSRISEKVKPKTVKSRLPVAADGPTDPGRTHTGRKPVESAPAKVAPAKSAPAKSAPAKSTTTPRDKVARKSRTDGKTRNQLLAMAKKMKICLDPKIKKAEAALAIETIIEQKKKSRPRSMRPASKDE